MKARDTVIDSIKFVLICLVIFGHAIEPSRYNTSIIGWIYSPIYLFHMPLFILLSGYFSKEGTMKKILQSSVRLIETYLIMCIVVMLYNRSYYEFIIPSYANWYLLSLIFWRWSVFALGKCKMGGEKMVFFSMFVALSSFLVPYEKSQMFMSIGRTLQFSPFFVCGYLLTNKDINRLRNWKQKNILTVISIILCIEAGFYSCRCLHLLEFHRASLISVADETNMTIINILSLKVFVELSAIVLSLRILSCRCTCATYAKYGKDTLLFLVLQLVIVQLGAKFIPMSLIYELLTAIACILLGCILSEYGLSKWVTNPISNFIGSLYETK